MRMRPIALAPADAVPKPSSCRYRQVLAYCQVEFPQDSSQRRVPFENARASGFPDRGLLFKELVHVRHTRSHRLLFGTRASAR
mgnify:CR=1 FL=1